MNISLSLPVPGNRKDRAARRRAKPPAHPPPLALEALEDRTVPSAVPHALPAVIAVVPPAPAISSSLALGGSPAAGALHALGGIPAQVSTSHPLQAPLHGAPKVLSTLSSDPHKLASQLSGITSSAMHGTGKQLGDAIQAARRRAGNSILGQGPNLTSSDIAQLILLSNVARNPGAIPSNLNGLAASATGNTAQLLNTVLTGVTGNLNNVASNLQALSGTLSGTTAATTADATALLDSVMTDVASSLSTVLSSLKTLVGLLPDVISIFLSDAQQLLQSALTDVTGSLGAISGSLDTIADQLPGVLGSLPSDAPLASAPDDWAASPLSGLCALVGGLLTEVSNILSTLSGSLSFFLGGLLSGTLIAAAPATRPPCAQRPADGRLQHPEHADGDPSSS